MLSAIGGFNVGMFAESADNDPFLWLAKQGVIQFWFIISFGQATLMVCLNPSLLAFR